MPVITAIPVFGSTCGRGSIVSETVVKTYSKAPMSHFVFARRSADRR